MKTLTHHYDICVVGGGLSGMCASIAAARHGAKVALVHDRPVFGGNASSEIRMWPLGAHGSNRRETGIFEELVLENMRVNPMRTYPNWDAVLYSAIYEQENLDCFMNCTVNDLQTENGKITEIKLYPIELGMEKPRSQKGVPVMNHSNETLEYLQKISQCYNTKIDIADGVGTIRL